VSILTANRLDDGRVIYLGEDDRVVEAISEARVLDEGAAEAALAYAAARPGVFVNPYLVETDGHRPSGRDRLKETIRSAGPTVGNSLRRETA